MAEMEIFWNRKYCVEFLDEMISYCGKSENILAHNLMIFLYSVDIVTVSWQWSILYIDISMPIRWLAACSHTMKEYGREYISMGEVLDNMKDDLNMILD